MANTNGISSDYYLSSYQAPQRQTGSSALGKDAFLQILITQLQNQDPTQPMDDKQFISQMAQFSSLEQMQNVASGIKDLLESQQQSQLMNYTSFIGKEVKWLEMTKDKEGNSTVNEGTDVINELKFVDGQPVFILEDGKEITPGNISSILNKSSSTISENPLVTASNLIGKTIQYDNNGEMLQAIIESVSTNNTVIEYILNNGSRITKDQFELVK
ncbi:flagellar basal-body rod modification protein FlgD [Lysinibacillus composti]|uniref:Basal-body rod modification protein FlgD n=1 Tax=Lysinibacillus composti TaxID=720633 RepID=A0A3N9UFK1_9BACI|nr:flagellar hook assembly protein FlgD [Lysinibacillus composti]MBM7608362.1 flagellar basal-body rod modification protein FlgD [Lysinibacillus composti]RQW74959.1 flagellar hook assembly protein FlgD [Lysinibacillus composti]